MVRNNGNSGDGPAVIDGAEKGQRARPQADYSWWGGGGKGCWHALAC